jgi:hypothetical protein
VALLLIALPARGKFLRSNRFGPDDDEYSTGETEGESGRQFLRSGPSQA